jgi:peptidoglycan/xylan/chitin deacetylase (PgdA/CDA1 family)
MDEGKVVLHAAAAEGAAVAPLGARRGSPGAMRWVVAGAGERIPPADAEAFGVRRRRDGAELEWGEPVGLGVGKLVALCRARGGASVAAVRSDPSLLPDLQLGSWFDVHWRFRGLRRLAARAAPAVAWVARVAPRPRLVATAVDAAFWAGVRAAATKREWHRFTRSSYAALYYHRVAGEGKPGQERIDISPARFARQLRLLGRLGFAPLSAEEIVAFHTDPDALLPRRAYALTVDDGFRDAVEALAARPEQRAQMFVCTNAVGSSADWAGGEPVAGWDEFVRLAESGAYVGSHGASHADLTSLEAVEDELEESRRELERRLGSTVPLLAYPHGRRDDRVRRAAESAGYTAAYTTDPGRNGAGTSPYDLRRVGPKEWDSSLSFLWKALTGELVPARWERWLLVRARLRSRWRRSSDPRAVAATSVPSGEATPRREQP